MANPESNSVEPIEARRARETYWSTVLAKNCRAILNEQCPWCGLSFAGDARPVVENGKGVVFRENLRTSSPRDRRLGSSVINPLKHDFRLQWPSVAKEK